MIMGRFMDFIKENGAQISEEKLGEFEQRLEALFQAGGMMNAEYVSLYGMKVMMLRKASMQESGMSFGYNYFEDDFWESAGYNRKEHRVYSGKVGWGAFCSTMLAAYVMEELYTDGVAFTMIENYFAASWRATGWMNYLFQDHYCEKVKNPWKVYETYHYSGREYPVIDQNNVECFIDDFDSTWAWYSVVLVNEGITSFLNNTNAKSDKSEMNRGAGEQSRDSESSVTARGKESALAASVARLIWGIIDHFHKKETSDDNEQIEKLLGLLRLYYESGMEPKEFEKECERDGLLEYAKFIEDDMPAVVVKAIAEFYNRDFWELWTCIRNVVNKSSRVAVRKYTAKPASPMSTAEYLHVDNDDLIPYWDGSGRIQFSDELEAWFLDIKRKYDEILSSDRVIEKGAGNVIRWIFNLLKYASDEYYRIFVFADFFEETLENLSDRRYLVLWMLFEDMLYDPKLHEAGSVIFLSESEAQKRHRSPDEGTERILKNWWFTFLYEEKLNEARRTLRRYLALVANKELRKKVFGF